MATVKRQHVLTIPRPPLGGGTTKVSGHRGGARYESRIPEIIAETPVRALALATALAEETAALAKPNAPTGLNSPYELRDSLEGVPLKRGEDAAVMAVWYWFFLEFGTVHGPHLSPRPFLLPAFEVAKRSLPALAKEAFAGL